jgi:serine protease Do
MNAPTKQLVVIAKKLAIPAGIVATLVLSFAFLTTHLNAHAALLAAPMDNGSVEPLVALDNAVEAVAARVTPAVVNVAVTSRMTSDMATEDGEAQEGGPDGGQNGGQNGGRGFGGINPQDLPPQFRHFFFFGPNGQGGPQQPQIEHGIGSGVIISPDGFIVTNDHVVDGATQIRVTLDDRRVFTAKLVGVDKLNDLAVIKIDQHNLPSIAWGDSTKLHPGQTVLAFGNPFGNFPFTVTRGIISGLDRPNPYSDDARKPGDYIQTDAAINPGNSGGPLVNSHGELIGIDTFIISNSGSFAGAGFAIPVQLVKASADQIIASGSVHHGYLGISMNAVTPDNANFFNLPDASGAIVSEVTPDSPAEHAGLKGGDVIRTLDGKTIANASALQVAVSEMTPGTRIELGILREGKQQTISLTVGEYHAKQVEEASNSHSGGAQGGKLGIALDELTPDVRQQFNIPDRVKGAAIQNVRPGSAADDAGLAPGDVILEVNRKPVDGPSSCVNAIHAVPENKDILLLVWANGGQSFRVLHPTENAG